MPEEPPRPTQSPRMGWVTLLLLLGAVALFVWILLPMTRPEPSPLLGVEAPDFVLPVVAGGPPGNRIRLSELAGRVIVLDFWASWCAPCREQGRIIDELARDPDLERVTFLGVATAEPEEDARRSAAEANPAYPSVHDGQGVVAATYGATDLPLLVVVTPDGRVAAVRSGVVPADEIRELIRGAL